MIHDDETREAEMRSNPQYRPSYWAEDDHGQAGTPGGARQRNPWSVALPVALVIMVALIAFLIIWMLLHHGKSSSTSGAPTNTPSLSQSTQGSSGPSVTTNSPSTSVMNSGSTTSGAGSIAQPSTTATSTGTPSQTSADFPASAVDSCADYLGAADGYRSKNPDLVSIGDPGVRVNPQHRNNSCDFVQDAARNIRSSMSDGSTGRAFEVREYSAWRAANGEKDAEVVLKCTAAGGLAHCLSTNGHVDMYVKP